MRNEMKIGNFKVILMKPPVMPDYPQDSSSEEYEESE